MSGAQKLLLHVAVDDGLQATFANQTGWFVQELKKHGRAGLTKADYPGLHVGDIVMRIRRKLGEEVIITSMEPNKHPWGGEHGRYRLNADITITDITNRPKKKTLHTACAEPLNSNTNGLVSEGLNV